MPPARRLRSAIFLATLFAVLSSRVAVVAHAAPPASVNTELEALMERVKAKLDAGKQTEADFADELKGFDAIVAEHATEKTEDVASVEITKAQLYLGAFQNARKALEIFKKVRADFPALESAAQLDDEIAGLERKIEVEPQLQVGKPFPGFAEKDLDGKPLAVADYKGKVLLIDFWATWCGPCRRELPNVIDAYQKFHSKGFEIVGVSLDEERDKVENFIKAKDMPWPEYFDGKGWKNKVGRQFAILSIPASFLLDRNGIIVARDLRGGELTAKLGELMP